jgi:predicted amino acid racemase
LGRETIHRTPWPGTSQNAFTLYSEILELKTKPSLPVGRRGEDAFGLQPIFEDRGPMLRALLNVGREDVNIKGLTPLDPGMKILGGSSGYLVVDVTAASQPLKVGTKISFDLNYGALLAAMTSGYVKKRYLPAGEEL